MMIDLHFQRVGIDGSKLNVTFFSEVNDKFDFFYINGQLIKTLIINTSVTDSDIVNILSYLFDYSRNER
jgi:replication initiation and membrane attachment protein DnaB